MDGSYDQLRAAMLSPSATGFNYPSLSDALRSTDDQARDAMYGPQGTLQRDKADFAGNVKGDLQQGLSGFSALRDAMIPKTAAEAGQMALYSTPVVGSGLSAKDAYNGYQEGDWRKTGLGLAGAVPLIGGIFGGALAKTADHAALARAGEMAAAGHGADAIWKETGWFQGPDQKWRFEIPDNQSQMYTVKEGERPLSDVLHHNKLYEAYPDAANTQVRAQEFQPELGGAYDRDAGNIYLNTNKDTYNPNRRSSYPGLRHSCRIVPCTLLGRA